MAGNSSEPASVIWYRRCTPVVVSSVTPLMASAMRCHTRSSSAWMRVSSLRMISNSSESAVDGSGTLPAFSNSTPLCTTSVASPPSSRIMLGPPPSGQRSARSVQSQYSSSVSPFHAKTGMPAAAIAAAAWSWVEKMLQLAQRTSAPSSTSVSMSTAVWIVMCNEPVMRAPVRGLVVPYRSRRAMRPGISCSASSISLRPNSASERSATWKSDRSVAGRVAVVVTVQLLADSGRGPKRPRSDGSIPESARITG